MCSFKTQTLTLPDLRFNPQQKLQLHIENPGAFLFHIVIACPAQTFGSTTSFVDNHKLRWKYMT